MYKLFNFRRGMVFFVLLIAFVCVSCSRPGFVGNDKVVAYVNKEPIFESDLKRSLEIKSRIYPDHQASPEAIQKELNAIIDKKLIIQEAVRYDLIRKEKFVNTIKTFWEQTLIRDYIAFKKDEVKDAIQPTDQEIQEYYNHLGYRVIFKVLKSKDQVEVDQLYQRLQTNIEIGLKDFETIGPLGYDDINSKVFLQAFDAPVGHPQKIQEGAETYIIMVISRDKIAIDPIEDILPRIKRNLMAVKEKQLLDSWLENKRENADIKILQ